MRRILGSGLLLLALSATALPTQAVAGTPEQTAGRSTAHATADARRADRALAHAREALAGHGPDATIALAQLRASYPHLSASEKKQADTLLARPTDGKPGPGNPGDPNGNGYDYDGEFGDPAVDATPLCGVHVCIHYVTGSDDAPDPADLDFDGVPDWVEGTLTEMEAVWTYEVGTRGYRAPASDLAATNNGGDAKLDVYLANVSGQGLYGYCAPEGLVAGEQYRAYGYCVLDDDYVGFPTSPVGSLKVTAAHEFFHMIQFNYDVFEDSWIMEATATWMEERYADSVNDNRYYLPDSQMHRPSTPLDTFSGCCQQYGNWIFFERLSRAYGVDAVRTIWQRLDTAAGKPDDYSVQAIKHVLIHHKTTFSKFYTAFAAGNLFPKKFYEEGSFYLNYRAPVSTAWKFTPRARFVTGKKTSLTHLTSRNYAFVPGSTMKGTWFLTVTVDGAANAPGQGAEVIIVKKNKALVTKRITLNQAGNGKVRVSFGAGTIKRITLTLANASTNYTCWKGTAWACMGTPPPARTIKFSAVASR